MFALSLSLKILTACLIQGADKKRMKINRVSFAIECSMDALNLSRVTRFLVSHFTLCASKVCMSGVFYYCCSFSSILPQFNVYSSFTLSKIRSQRYSGILFQFTQVSFKISFREGSRSNVVSIHSVGANLRSQVYLLCQTAANLLQKSVD